MRDAKNFKRKPGRNERKRDRPPLAKPPFCFPAGALKSRSPTFVILSDGHKSKGRPFGKTVMNKQLAGVAAARVTFVFCQRVKLLADRRFCPLHETNEPLFCCLARHCPRFTGRVSTAWLSIARRKGDCLLGNALHGSRKIVNTFHVDLLFYVRITRSGCVTA